MKGSVRKECFIVVLCALLCVIFHYDCLIWRVDVSDDYLEDAPADLFNLLIIQLAQCDEIFLHISS
jgi:hypothetical protein